MAVAMTRRKEPRNIPNSDPAYTTREAGIIMGGLDTSTVWRLCNAGKLGYYKVGTRRKIRQSDIDAYLKKNTFPPREE